MQFLGNAFKYGGGKSLACPPRTGEHTEEVLRDVCGYDRAKIESLARDGAVVLTEP